MGLSQKFFGKGTGKIAVLHNENFDFILMLLFLSHSVNIFLKFVLNQFINEDKFPFIRVKNLYC